jgi:hypothetical protein
MIPRSGALGELLAKTSTSKAQALGYSYTDIDVPGSPPGTTGFFRLGMNDHRQVVGTIPTANTSAAKYSLVHEIDD